MKLIETDKKIDGRFVIDDREARALLYVLHKMEQLEENKVKEIMSLDSKEDAETIDFLLLELDLLREKMEILSDLRHQIRTFDFESDQDEVEA